jgi:hypothetical protein
MIIKSYRKVVIVVFGIIILFGSTQILLNLNSHIPNDEIQTCEILMENNEEFREIYEDELFLN